VRLHLCDAASIVIALKGQRTSHRLQPVQDSASNRTANFVHQVATAGCPK
jgi:hypothetical protein